MIAACVLMAVAVASLVIGRIATGDPISPVAVAVAAWSATLGLFELQLVPYVPLSALAWRVTIAALACLVAGLFAGMRLPARPRVATPTRDPDALRRARAWVPVFAVLGLTGMGWFVWNVGRILGWDALADGNRIREALGAYTIPSGFLFLQFFCIVTPLVAITIRLLGQRLRVVDVAAASVCALCTWLSTDRTQFFALAISALFLALYTAGRKLSMRQLVVAACAVGLLLFANFVVVARWVGKTSAASVYVYATASFPAWDRALHAPPAGTGGLHTFYPVARLLERLRVVDGPTPSPILQYVEVTRGQPGGEWSFNGYTWLNYPYQDWGLTGVFLYVTVVGVTSGWLYGRFRANRSQPVLLLLVAQVTTALALSPFVNKFNNTASWYVAVMTTLPFVLPRWTRAAPTGRAADARAVSS